MNSQNNYTVEDVLEIVNTLPEKDKETLKSILLGDALFEGLVKEDFVKYEATFKKLA